MLFERAVRREIWHHASLVFASILTIWISVLLVRTLGDAASGQVGATAVLGLVAISTLNAMPTVLLVTVFIAVLLTVGRAYRDSEMVIWLSSGLSLRRWIRPVLEVAGPIAFACLLINGWATPWAQRQLIDYRQRFEQRSDITRVTPGQFLESGDSDRVFFIERAGPLSEQVMRIFVRWVRDGQLGVVVANTGYVEQHANGDRFLLLDGGYRYDLQLGAPALRRIHYSRYGIRLENRSRPSDVLPSMRSLHLGRLLARLDTPARGELLWRLSLPFALINLALLAIPLSFTQPRGGRAGNMLLALLIAMVYLNLIALLQAYVQQGRLPFVLSFCLLHGLALFAVISWLSQRARRLG